MKKATLLILLLFVSTVFYAQSSGITYQAIIYNPNGEVIPGYNNANSPLANKNVCLQFSIVDAALQTEYQEKITTTTDEFGMVNLVIGTGIQTGGYATSFATIYWSVSQKSLKVALDSNGQCSTFVEISNQPFTSVPFAFTANSAENVTGVVPIENGGTNAITVLGAKTNLGLENVDNTRDINKPISIATQTALNLKEDLVNKSNNVTTDGTSTTKYPTVKSVKDYVDASNAAGVTALANEALIRAAADTTLTNNLSIEVANRTNADLLKEDLVNKSNNVTTDGTSTTKYPSVKSIKTYVDAGITTASNALVAETAARIAADNTLTANLATEVNRATATDNTLTTNLLSEFVRATATESTLTSNLATEVNRASAAEATKEILTNKSNNVTTDGTSTTKYPTVKSVKDYVDASATSGTAALTNEATIRANADTTLTTNLATEVTNRTNADTTLQTNINTLGSTVTANATTAANATALKENSANKSTDVTLADATNTKFPTELAVKTYVNASAASGTAALSNEATIRANADTTLTTNLATEVTNRTNADTTLQTNINTLGSTVTANATTAANATALKENSANKSTTVTLGTSDTLFPTQNAVKTYVDASATSGTSALSNEATIRANADTTLTTNLATEVTNRTNADTLLQTNINTLGSTVTANATTAANATALKENSINKSTTTTLGTSDVLFPTQNAVKTYVDAQVASATIADADATTKGKIQLAGDLGGTAAVPTVPGLAFKAPIASPTFTGTVTSPIYASAPQALTDATTIIWNPNNGLNASATLGGNRTLSFSSMPAVGSYGTLVITQDASGNRTITLPSTSNKVLGSTSTTTIALSTAANAKDIINFYYDGTNCYWNIGQGYGIAATIAPTNLVAGVTGTLPVANGGTGSATLNFVDLTTAQTVAGAKSFTSNVTASSFVKSGGTASQFLKADGTVDSATYLTTAGTATNVSGVVAVANGGTGATTDTAALANLTGTQAANTVLAGPSSSITTISTYDCSVLTGWTNSGGTSIDNTIGNPSSSFKTVGANQSFYRDLGQSLKNKIIEFDINLTSGVAGFSIGGVGNLGLKMATGNSSINGIVDQTSWLYPNNSNNTYTFNPGTWYTIKIITDNGSVGGTTWYVNGILIGNSGGYSMGNGTYFGILTDGATANYDNIVIKDNSNTGGVPTFRTLVASDIPTLNQNTSGYAATVTTNANLTGMVTSNGNATTVVTNADLTGPITSVGNTTSIASKTGTGSTFVMNTSPTLVTPVLGVASATSIISPLYVSTPQVLASGSAISWNPANGLNASVTLNQNSTLSFSSTPMAGTYGTLVITQDASGGRTLTLPSTANKILGSTSTTTIALSAAASAKDILNFYYDGTNCYWNIGQGYGIAATVASTNLTSSVTGTLPVANGGTGATTQNFVDLTTDQTITGAKTFSSDLSVNGLTVGLGAGSIVSNTANGFKVLYSNTTGIQNTASGMNALRRNINGVNNTVSGMNALTYNTNGSNNSAFGQGTLYNNIGGQRNTANGGSSLYNNTSGNYNTASGFQALYTNATGSYNTAIGNGADVSVDGLTNSTAIGNGAIVAANNTIQLGNTSVTALNTSGALTTGTITYPNTSGSANQLLTTDGNGVASWATAPASGDSVTEVADEISATVGQVAFTLTQTPAIKSKVKMYINGIRITNTAYTINGTTLTYVPANNGAYALILGDRIQFDYYF